jgi:hypothetical protein
MPSRSSSSRPRRAAMTDDQGVAEMLSVTPHKVHEELRCGRLPAPIEVGGEQRWRINEIRSWIKAGLPPRAEWERRMYRQ